VLENPIGGFVAAGTDPDIIAGLARLAERAAEKRYGLVEPQFVVLDTETTGLDPAKDELIEIAAAIVDGPEVIDTFQTFVDPGRPIPALASDITSISDEDVVGAPTPAEAVARLEEFVGDRTVIAHNARFDQSFLGRLAGPRSPLSSIDRWIDTLGLSRIALPRLAAHDQSTLSDAFGIVRGNHRAIGDVLALSRLWRVMLAALDDLPRELLGFFAQIAPGNPWPMRQVIEMVAPDAADLRFSMPALRDRRIRSGEGGGKDLSDPDGRLDLAGIDDAEVEAAFCEDGVVGAMYETFERREEQVAFALEVAEAFRTSTHRIIEAGTGVGKSVSYLLPAVLFARENRVRVGVATKTNTLLDQLVARELPLLDAALRAKTGAGFSYISVKGYDHYPCLRKLMRYARDLDEESSEYDIVAVCSTMSSIAQATWGDLDGLPVTYNNYLRARIVCSPDECLHGKCAYFPRRCLLHGARRRAAESEVVVTNHALLFRDIASDKAILPPIRYWVVDEAHGIEEEARGQFSHRVAAADLAALLRDLGAQSGPIKQIQHRATGLEGGSSLLGLAVTAHADIAPASELSDLLFSAVRELRAFSDSKTYSVSDVWINADVRADARWDAVADAGGALVEQLDKTIKDCHRLSSMCGQFDELAEQATELAAAGARLEDALAALSLVLDGANPDYYYHAEAGSDPARQAEALAASLVDLGGELSSGFFPEANSVILTSATIAVAGSFDGFAHRVGLDRIDPDLWSARCLEPSSGFYANMRTLVVEDLPEPRAAGYREELARLILNIHLGLRGGVLTLFTNRREMEDVYREVGPILAEEGIELLCQLSGKSRRMLREQFTQSEDACLFATRSFWEGFDAPGRTLRCVVLPKLPFSRPDDPLYQERNMRQKDAWKSYVLPQAIIDTRQAAGRLIRARSDSGFLILGDRRLTTKWYGKVFLKAFPPDRMEKVSIDDIADLLMSSGV